MTKKYMFISLDDEKAKKIAEVIGNKTCKKIIDFLAEKSEASEKDIADFLKSPLNTIEYNLKKLLDAEIVEKTKNFFWSKKGKKILMYKLSNKSILISPRSKNFISKAKSIIPVVLISGVLALLVRQTTITKEKIVDYANIYSSESGAVLQKAGETQDILIENGNFFFTQPSPVWIWFLSGMVIAILIFAIINWRKI